jgi:hypothetical protein
MKSPNIATAMAIGLAAFCSAVTATVNIYKYPLMIYDFATGGRGLMVSADLNDLAFPLLLMNGALDVG